MFFIVEITYLVLIIVLSLLFFSFLFCVECLTFLICSDEHSFVFASKLTDSHRKRKIFLNWPRIQNWVKMLFMQAAF